MKLGIIGAMQVEVETLVSRLENLSCRTVAWSNYYEGKLEGLDVVVVQLAEGTAHDQNLDAWVLMGQRHGLDAHHPGLSAATGTAIADMLLFGRQEAPLLDTGPKDEIRHRPPPLPAERS